MAQFKKNHNKQLSKLLQKINEIAQKAMKEEDFKEIFSLLKNFTKEQPIKYDHSAKYKFAFGVIILGTIATLLATAMPSLKEIIFGYWYVSYSIIALLLIIPCIIGGSEGSKISKISDLIFEKDLFFDNELKVKGIKSGTGMYEKLYQKFGEFRDRGDEDRYIENMINGNHKSEIFSYPYDYYVFHYVEVDYVPVVTKDGVKMERQETTCYRYGLLLDFKLAKEIAIISSGGRYRYKEEWIPTSKELNDIFNVYCNNKIDAAKFLQPSVVMAFLDIAKHMHDLNVEINKEGQMNIAFSDEDVLFMKRKQSIAEPEEFEKEIMSMLRPPKLNRLLYFIETLKKYNDENF